MSYKKLKVTSLMANDIVDYFKVNGKALYSWNGMKTWQHILFLLGITILMGFLGYLRGY